MKIAFRFLIFILFITCNTWGNSEGSVIVLNTKGTVQASPQNGRDMLPIQRGTVLPKGYSLTTGKFSEAVLLFSNGTLSTVGESSTLRVSTFEQAPFDPGNKKLADIKSEPSQSTLALDLLVGDLVVQTKKLNKGSTFSIHTTAGTAGIRGTQFQLNLSPAGSLSLDVAESVVAFSPSGGGPMISISTGNGLDSSATGAVSQRPISVNASQAILAKNSSATSLSANVPLVTVGEANKKAASVSTQGQNDQSGSSDEETSDEEESSEEENSDDKDSEEDAESSSGAGTEKSPPQAETNAKVKFQVRTDEIVNDYLQSGLSKADIRKLADKFGVSADQILKSGLTSNDIVQDALQRGESTSAIKDIIKDSLDKGESISDILGDIGQNDFHEEELKEILDELNDEGEITDEDYENTINDLLENPTNPSDPPNVTPGDPPLNYQLVLSAGDDDQTGTIDDQLNFRIVNNEGVSDTILENLSIQDIGGLFSPLIDNENPYTADIIAVHALSKIRPSDLLIMGEENVNHSLRSAISITSILLTNVDLSSSTPLTDADISSIYAGQSYSGSTVLSAKDLIDAYENNHYLYELAKSLADYGAFSNKEAVEFIDDILEFAGGMDNLSVPDTLYLNTKKSGASPSLFALTPHNQFFGIGKGTEGISEESDQLFKIHPDNISAVVGSEIKIGTLDSKTTQLDTSRWLEKAQSRDQKKIFAITATDDVIIQGDLHIKNDNPSEDHALVIGAADHIEIYGDGDDQDGKTDIFFEGSNLALGSHGTLIMKSVEIDTGGNLAIGSLDELHLNKTSLNVGRFSDRDNVYLYADHMLSADGLDFHGRTREIHMEARTLDLKNVHFPEDSEVLLRSRDGYPNFYGGIYSDNSRKPYAVNFYSDSNKYGNSPIRKGEFIEKSDGNFESSTLRTGSGSPGIQIEAFPK